MRNISQRKAGVILSYVNLGLACIIPFIYTPIMLRLLGQEEYGLFNLSNAVIGYLNLLSFGMGSAIIRYATRCRAENKPDEVRGVMGLFMAIYGFLAVLVCVVGAVLVANAGLFFSKGLTGEEVERLKVLMIIMIANTALSLPLSVLSSIIVAYERFFFSKVFAIIGTILLPTLNLIVLSWGYASIGMAWISFALAILSGCVYGVYCVKRLNLYPDFKRMPVHLLKEIWVFSAFVFLSSIVDMLYWATDKVLIGAMAGTAAVAVYNIGGTFTSILQNMAHAISSVFSSNVNMMVAKNVEKSEISALMIRIGRLQYLVVSLILSGYITFGQAFIRFWAGPSYADAYWVALVTMIPLSVPLIQNIAFATILADNKHRFRSIVYAIIAALNVVSTYLLLPHYGIIGAAVCTAVSFVLGQGIVMNIYYYRVIKLDIPAFWMNIGKMSFVPGCMALAGVLLIKYIVPVESLWQVLAGVIIYTAIFAVLSWFISMNRYEKDLAASLAGNVFLKRKVV